jgi:hypothetical protein
MNMTNDRHWKVSLLGAMVAVATLVTACDPYLGANTAAPAVIGIMVVPGASANRNYNFVVDQPAVCPGGLPYPPASGTWFASTFPGGKGNCGDGTTVLVACPEDCWPPRTGPGFAPYYLGDFSGSYGCAIPGDPRCPSGKYSYAPSAAYTLTDIPPLNTGPVNDNPILGTYRYNQMRILFNKGMKGETIQKLAANATAGSLCDGADGITVTKQTQVVDAAPVDIKALVNVCYVPSSSNLNWGSSMTVQYRIVTGTSAPPLQPLTTYRVSGTVEDAQGNPLTVDATFTTGEQFVAPAPAKAAP